MIPGRGSSLFNKSIIFGGLLLFISTGFVFLSADHHLAGIIDSSQYAVYASKTRDIVRTLKLKHQRLEKTGMVEAYRKSFQQSIIQNFQDRFYQSRDNRVYPVIIDGAGTIIMHPELAHGSTEYADIDFIKKIIARQNGEIYFSFNKTRKWSVFTNFDEWDWIVIYSIPLDIKYADLYEFRKNFALITAMVIFTAIMILLFFVRKITTPIAALTRASAAMAEGKDVDCSLVPTNDEIGMLTHTFAIMRDSIKDQFKVIRENETELIKLRNYLSNIIDSMPSVLIGVNIKGKVTQWNKPAEQITGIIASAAHGKILSDIFPGMAPQMEKIAESIQTRKIKQEQKISRPSREGLRFEDITIYPLIANGVEGAVIRVDDVTEKIRMEEMMMQSEKMLSVGGLAAGMAHEINNPLAGMIQTADVMKNRLTDIEMPANKRIARETGISMEAVKTFMEKRGIPRMLNAINESGHRVAQIVENMLSFARKSDASISSHNPADLLDRTLDLAASEYDLKSQTDFKAIEIVKEYADNLPLLPCEGSKIQQVILNILRNGAQAMQEAGKQKTGKCPRFILRLSHEIKTNMLTMEIEDNGPGMDEKTCKRIFEPFFTTKPLGTGTGLGLSVSYFIITENHGGTMDVVSKPGKGTIFILCLPINRQMKQAI